MSINKMPIAGPNGSITNFISESQLYGQAEARKKVEEGEYVPRRRVSLLRKIDLVKILGNYMLGEIIGRGSCGKVKEGICTETLQCVAVKIVTRRRLKKICGGEESLLGEISILRRIKHKNCVRLLNVYSKSEGIVQECCGENVQKRYLVFEYCANNLQELIDSCGVLYKKQTHEYFVQLMVGIEYLHSKNIIHHDIKPANLLVTFEHELKITDFGIAEEISVYDGFTCENCAGTPLYMAPECFTQDKVNGEKIDVWACGIVLYNMAHGSMPYDVETFYDHVGEALIVENPILGNILNGLLQVDPQKRLGVQQILRHEYIYTPIEGSRKDYLILHVSAASIQNIPPFSLFPAILDLFPEIDS